MSEKQAEKPLATKTPEEIIRDQRILDNIMVAVFFEPDSLEAKEALEEILRILLNDPALVVERFQPEYVLTNIGHHGVRVDVWARDGNGRQLALELQKDTDAEIYPRAVFEAATMIVHSLPAGDSYRRTDKAIVIFFTQDDLEGNGKPLHLYESTQNGIPGKLTPLAPSYLFVNGSYRNETTKLGRLIADIMEPTPSRIHTPILRHRMNTLKNTEEGKAKMEAALEKYVAKAKAEEKMRLLFELVREGDLSVVKAAKRAGLSVQEFEAAMNCAV